MAKRLNSIFGMISSHEKLGAAKLSKLETTLFDSIEFCLALLGMLPVPVFIVDKNKRIITLSLGHLEVASERSLCAHLSKDERSSQSWRLPDKLCNDCVFCATIEKAMVEGKPANAKGEWKTASGKNGQEKSLVVSVHAAPAKIKDEDYVLVVVEDNTELERLRGLLPICMECNKIHDPETSRWVRIDQYITDHSPAKFSHGLCPACAERLLKEIEN